jgi:hypothetical protein
VEEGVVDVEEDNGVKEDDKENVRKMVLMRMVKSIRILKRRMVRKMVRKRKKIAL